MANGMWNVWHGGNKRFPFYSPNYVGASGVVTRGGALWPDMEDKKEDTLETPAFEYGFITVRDLCAVALVPAGFGGFSLKFFSKDFLVQFIASLLHLSVTPGKVKFFHLGSSTVATNMSSKT